MEKKKTYYWVSTGLSAVSLGLLSLMAVAMPEKATEMFNHLGYTDKLVLFIVVARMLAVLVLLIPKFPKLKEWAYAGLVFELIGALYSHIRAGDTIVYWLPALVILAFVLTSYVFYSAIDREKTSNR